MDSLNCLLYITIEWPKYPTRLCDRHCQQAFPDHTADISIIVSSLLRLNLMWGKCLVSCLILGSVPNRDFCFNGKLQAEKNRNNQKIIFEKSNEQIYRKLSEHSVNRERILMSS